MIYSYFKIFSSFLNVYIEFFNYLSIRFAGENCVNDNQCKNSQHSEESKTRFCKEGKVEVMIRGKVVSQMTIVYQVYTVIKIIFAKNR